MGEPAHLDVEANFPNEKTAFAAIFGPAPTHWIAALKHKDWVVFYTAAYLLLTIAKREKTGRSADTQTKLGIALYHGGRSTVVKAQTNAAASLGKKTDHLTWAEIEVELRKLPNGPDIIDYVDGVVGYRFDTLKKDFTFNVKAQLIGRTRFTIGEYGTVKVTAKGDYDATLMSTLAPDPAPPPNYWIKVGGEKVKFETGKTQTFTWHNLSPGEHILRIYNRYINGTIPLIGEGALEVRV
jgi:hypothetical protein